MTPPARGYKIKLERGELVLRIPLADARGFPSNSGRNWVVASSSGAVLVEDGTGLTLTFTLYRPITHDDLERSRHRA